MFKRLKTLRALITSLVMVVIFCAGALKFVEFDQWLASLKTWTIIPASMRAILGIGVPSLEVCVSLCWLLGVRGSAMRYGAAAMMGVWSSAYCLEAYYFGTPTCNCFGRWLIGAEFAYHRRIGGGSLNRASTGTPPPPAQSPVHVQAVGLHHNRRAFTIIELVLVIAIVAVLIAQLAPSLAAVRLRGKSIQALSDLHTHCTVIGSYAADFRDAFPCIADPAYTQTILRSPDDELILDYFDQRIFWWFGLAPAYYNGDFHSPSFFAPRRRGSGRGQPYSYSVSLVARPEYWNQATRTPTGQYGIVFQSETFFPSKKVVYLNGTPLDGPSFYQNFSKPVVVETGLCDGSAIAAKINTFLSPVVNGEGPISWPYSRVSIGIPGIHTLDGFRGRDLP